MAFIGLDQFSGSMNRYMRYGVAGHENEVMSSLSRRKQSANSKHQKGKSSAESPPSSTAPRVLRVWSEKTLAYLLRLEKERRGIPASRRCFVGISDLARHEARIEEIEYFYAYLSDRSECASRLGLISKRPKLQMDWLPIAAQVSFEDRHRLFLKEEQEVRPAPFICLIDTSGREHPADEQTIVDYLAGRFEVVGMMLSSKPHKPVKAAERRN